MAWSTPASVSSPLSEGLFWRAGTFLGDFFGLLFLPDLRLEDPRFGVEASILGSAVDTKLTGDLEVDAINVGDVVDLDDFDAVVVLGVGCGFVLGLAMEADLEFMNPASVG